MEQAQQVVEHEAPDVAEVPDYRKRHRREIPEEYNPFVFFGTTNLAGLGIVAAAAWQIEDVAPLEWLTIPLAFLFANFVEYMVHRGPLHVKKQPLEILFNRHTLLHHDYFRHTDMAFTRRQELVAVLFPYWAIGLVLAAALVPYALLLMIATPNVAHLFVIVAIGYYLLYEWLHLVYHLPDESWVARLGLVQRLRQHHRIHHHRKLMTHYNFNITFPIFDMVFRTTYAGQNPDEEREHEAERHRHHHHRKHHHRHHRA